MTKRDGVVLRMVALLISLVLVATGFHLLLALIVLT
jgi:hypothetical protein